MPACTTKMTIACEPTIINLFLPVPDTDFRNFLEEVAELPRFAPGIITAIEADLDAHAREKKLRLDDRRFFESQTEDFPELGIKDDELVSAELTLGEGRPRMPADAVYVFLMMRGFLGSLSTKQSRRFLRESMSLSDGSAAYIKKGSRNPVIGYKPQLVRSQNGFVTSLLVPQGNAADSIKLVPAICDSIKRTGVIAELVSTDDGYASAKGRDELRDMGVKDISISGAKGKKLTDPDDWDSEEYRDARRNRSAVESLMFTIKDGFAFGELGRRGIASCQ
jgi:hypothetical protein